MALKTTPIFLNRGEQKEFDNIIGIVNDSNTPIYYDFEQMPNNIGGIPILKRGDEDKFPAQKVWVRATRAGSNILIVESE
jgi:hypothetical protein